MKAYLDSAKSHDTFMQQEIAEYEIGKRHLANMMGRDPETFTQDDIDKSIEYLLPSGLFDKKARPRMKHPTEVLPRRKAAEFGLDGRPFKSLFYTGHPLLYSAMHEMSQTLEELKRHEDAALAAGKRAQPTDKAVLGDSRWMDMKEVESSLNETLSTREYEPLLKLLERLADHPYSARAKKMLMQFRKPLPTQFVKQDAPPLKLDDHGRQYMDARAGRKKARATVTIRGHGKGRVTVNGQDMLDYFPRIADREQILFPLQFVGMPLEFDLDCKIKDGGVSSQAGAIRLATAVALQSFVDKPVIEKMRLAGLLSFDPRVRERKKYGQKGARAKYTWKKR